MINLLKKLFIPLIILLVILLNHKSEINNFFTSKTINFKLYMLSKFDGISNTYNLYKDQKNIILKLEKKNTALNIKNIKLISYKNELDNLLKNLNKEFLKEPNIYLSRTISYISLNDLSTLSVDFFNAKDDTIYGAIDRDGNVIGVVKRDKRLVKLYLNINEHTSYSVFIGKNKVVGSALGTNNGLVIKFISLKDSIKIGDAIYTRGLDGVFQAGLKVGIIKKIFVNDNFLEAQVDTYSKENNISYFYILKAKDTVYNVIDNNIKNREEKRRKRAIKDKNTKVIRRNS